MAGNPAAAGPEFEQRGEGKPVGLEAKAPAGAAPVPTRLEGQATVGATAELAAGVQLLLVDP
jgi:hypothetical protein